MKQAVHRIPTHNAEMFLNNAVNEGWRIGQLVTFGPDNGLILVVLEKKDAEELP